MNKQIFNIIGAVVSVLLLIGCFCKYVYASILGTEISTTLMKGGDGYIFIALGAIAVIMLFMNKDLVALIFSIINSVMAIYEMLDTSDKISGAYSNLISKGAGYYLMIIGTFGMLIVVIAKMIMDKKRYI